MRGSASKQMPMFYMINVEAELPANHPLRAIKKRADAILATMSRDFNAAYSQTGRPGIAPDQFNLLYRWFVDLSDDPVWTPETFSVNRERFEKHDLVRKFFDRIVAEAVFEGHASPDHFTVDGTLIRSWASLKSLQPKGAEGPKKTDDDPGNPSVDFHGETRTNATHVSASDPEARLMRKGKGQPAYLCHSGQVLMENRHGLCMDVRVDQADGFAERRGAKVMIGHIRRRHHLAVRTLGMDKGFGDGAFLADLERRGVKAHVPVTPVRRSSSEAARQAKLRAYRRRRTKGYVISQRIRKRVEEIFGWFKTVGGLARARLVGRWKIAQDAWITGAAYNLLRLARLEMVR